MQAKKPLPPSGAKPLSGQRYQKLLLDGERFFQQKEFDTARQIFAQALTLAPATDTRAAKELCRCYRKLALKALKHEHFAEVTQLLDQMFAIDQAKAYFKALD